MKFGRQLLRLLIPEWVLIYFDFNFLKIYLNIPSKVKKLLYKAKQLKQPEQYYQIKAKILRNKQLMEKLHYDKEKFIHYFVEEINKVEIFCRHKLHDFKEKLGKLGQQIKSMQTEEQQLTNYLEQSIRKPKSNQTSEIQHFLLNHDEIGDALSEFSVKKQKLKQSFYTFYQENVHFQNYVQTNIGAQKKIIKKFRKYTLKGIRKKQQLSQLSNLAYLGMISQKCKKMLDNLERIIIVNFYPTRPQVCNQNLRKYRRNSSSGIRTSFLFGTFFGICGFLIVILLLMRFDGYLDPSDDKIFLTIFPCFRGMALLLLYYWGLAFLVLIYDHYRINYKVFLNFNYHFSTYNEIFKRVCIFSTIYLICFVIYVLQVQRIGQVIANIKIFDPQYIPLIPWILLIAYVFIPTRKMLNGDGRFWMFRMIAGSLWGHFTEYNIRYNFFVDQMISLVNAIKDMDYTVCFYQYIILNNGDEPTNSFCSQSKRISALIAGLVPYTLKILLQVSAVRGKPFLGSRQMYNILKTILSIIVILLSFFSGRNDNIKYFWIIAAAISSLANFYWDIKIDWMFLQPKSKHKYLRNNLAMIDPQIYYCLIVANFFLRLTWALSVSPDIYIRLGIRSELFSLLIGSLEMVRRLISNLLRVEKEHIANMQILKAVPDVVYPFDIYYKRISYVQFFSDSQHSQLSISTLQEPECKEMDHSRLTRRANTQMLQHKDVEEKSQQEQKMKHNIQSMEESSQLDVKELERCREMHEVVIQQIKLENRLYDRVLCDLNEEETVEVISTMKSRFQ